MSNLRNYILSSFNNIYVNWSPIFDSKIIDIINKNSINKSSKNNLISDLTNYSKKRNTSINEDLKIITSNNTYIFIGDLSSGSCGSILIYQKYSKYSLGNYVLKFGLADEKKTTKNESTMHYIIHHFQKLNNCKIIPELDIILMTEDDFYHIMMEKLDSELSLFFTYFDPLLIIDNNIYTDQLEINKENKGKKFKFWNFYMEFLYQISKKLILLQDNFNFMHNDLKCNNILVSANMDDYKNDKKYFFSKLNFVICDLGGASLEYDGKKYEGSILGSNSKYSERKDLFHLVHMHLSFSEHRFSLMDFIENNEIFKLDKSKISSKKYNWIKIYTYQEDGNVIDESFNPRNLKKKLVNLSQ